jgi:hypothetical protein
MSGRPSPRHHGTKHEDGGGKGRPSSLTARATKKKKKQILRKIKAVDD